MDQEAALLAAIAAHPAEDTPRLAYADWLDEHAGGLPDPASARVRAEFIRVQCEIGKLEGLTRSELNRYVELYRRQDAILTHHRRELLGPLGEELTETEMNRDVVFDRGFVAELRLDAERFVKYGGAIASLKPLPHIRVVEDAWWRSPLFGSPHICIIRTLNLGPDEPTPPGISPTSELLGRMAESGTWAALHEVSLEGCRIQDEGLVALTVLPNLPNLDDLDVSRNEISDEGVRLLVNSPLWPRLKRLVLGGNPISDDGARDLADSAANSQLEYLNLKFTGITPASRPRLLEVYGGRIDLF